MKLLDRKSQFGQESSPIYICLNISVVLGLVVCFWFCFCFVCFFVCFSLPTILSLLHYNGAPLLNLELFDFLTLVRNALHVFYSLSVTVLLE